MRLPSATHLVATFKYHGDAVRFRQELEQRLAAFGLRVAPEKTALLRFDGNLLHGEGRPAVKPATFTFLGFTHYLRKARSGPINIERKPSVKARERFVRKVATWLKANVNGHRGGTIGGCRGIHRWPGGPHWWPSKVPTPGDPFEFPPSSRVSTPG